MNGKREKKQFSYEPGKVCSSVPGTSLSLSHLPLEPEAKTHE